MDVDIIDSISYTSKSGNNQLWLVKGSTNVLKYENNCQENKVYQREWNITVIKKKNFLIKFY